MQPNTSSLTDRSFTENPELKGTYLALGRQLADGGAESPPETLPLVSILRELQAASNSALNGRVMASEDDRKSFRDDLGRSIEAIAPELKTLLGAAVDDLRRELGAVPEHLNNAGGAAILLGHARTLLHRLEQREAAQAAWCDVVAIFESNAHAGTCELAVAQLRAIAELRGHEWSEPAGRLRGILVESASEVARARITLAERTAGEPPTESAVRAAPAPARRSDARQPRAGSDVHQLVRAGMSRAGRIRNVGAAAAIAAAAALLASACAHGTAKTNVARDTACRWHNPPGYTLVIRRFRVSGGETCAHAKKLVLGVEEERQGGCAHCTVHGFVCVRRPGGLTSKGNGPTYYSHDDVHCSRGAWRASWRTLVSG